MCGYCNKNDYVLFQKIKGTLFYLHGGKGSLMIQEPYCGAQNCKLKGYPRKVETNINFCPICGRSFTHGENE